MATSNYENDPSDPSEPNKSDEPTTIGLSAASVSGIANKTYNGKAQTQSITVKNGSDILAVGTDYMIAYSNNTNAGTAEVTITGMGSYTGSITKTFTIAPAKVTAPTAKTGLVYTGKSQTGVAAGANYTVATGSATNAGNYTAVAKLKDSRNYTWSDGSKADKKISWKITSKKITPAVTLSATAYTWNGKVKKPVVTVKAGSSTLTASQYSVKYASGRKNVGTYNVTVTLKGNYSGSKTVSFKINPKGTSISKLTTQQKAFTAIWSKQASKMSGRVTGYQLQYSTRKDFKSVNKTVTVTGWSKTSKKVTGLKAKTTYYVRVRTYTKSGGKTYYSGWSKIKTVKTPAAPVAAKTIGTVYWVANGKVYHLNKNCSTLSRSKNIQSGTIAQSGKASACKVCGH